MVSNSLLGNYSVLCVIAGVFALSTGLSWCLFSSSRLRLLDYPNNRSLHETPVPRTGGFAILLSLTIGLCMFFLIDKLQAGGVSIGSVLFSGDQVSVVSWILLMTLFLAAVSFLSDWMGLGIGARLVCHTAAGLGIAAGAGLFVDKAVLIPGSLVNFGGISILLTTLFLVWMANMYNFMDGMDGFAGGMAVIGFGFLGYIAWARGHIPISAISILVSAASAGFLCFNFPPEKIFMGT